MEKINNSEARPQRGARMSLDDRLDWYGFSAPLFAFAGALVGCVWFGG